MITKYYRMMDGSTRAFTGENEAETKAQARAAQARIANGEEAPPWDLGRIASLTGRAAVEGLTEGAGAIGALPADLGYNAFAAGAKGVDWALGTDMAPDFGMPVSGVVARGADALADAAGLAEPVTDNEKLAMAIGKGAIGALPGIGIGGAIQGVKGLTRAGEFLAASPYTQAASGAAGGGMAERTMQVTGDPRTAFLTGLVGGAGTGAGMSVASGSRVLARPLTRGGRDRIVGDALNMSATDPRRAQRNLQNVRQIVPGSAPLAGVASGDVGLINLQRGVERIDPQRRFAQNIEDANNARHRVLRANSMTEAEIDAASQARTAKADIDTDALFDTPQMRQMRVPTSDLMASLHGIKQDRRLYARQPVQEAVAAARRQIVAASKRNKTTGEMEINPGVLYSIRQNLAEAMSGKIRSDDMPNIKLAGRTGGDILDMIDDKIETAAPGFKAYMADLAQSGEARSQGRTAGEVYRAGTSKGPGGVTIDEPFLNLASLRKNFENRRAEMSPQQQAAFEQVLRDLERSSKVNSPSVRSAGSDTMQNLSVNSNMARLFGGRVANSPVGEAVSNFVDRLPIVGSRMGENATNDRMVETMLDPALASRLMRDSDARSTRFANSVVVQPVEGILGATRATTGQSQNWVVEDANGNRYDANGKLVK
jgi:hypothetical protein